MNLKLEIPNNLELVLVEHARRAGVPVEAIVIEAITKDKYDPVYSDIDCLVYSIQHPDIYQCIKDHKQHFDLAVTTRADFAR